MLFDNSFRLNANAGAVDCHSQKEEHWIDPSENSRRAYMSEFGRDDRRKELEQLVAMKATAQTVDTHSGSGLGSRLGKHKLR